MLANHGSSGIKERAFAELLQAALAQSPPVRWIQEHQIEAVATSYESLEATAQVQSEKFGVLGISASGQVAVNQLYGSGVLIHHDHITGTATECLETHGPCASKKIQNPEPSQIKSDNIKDGLPNSLGRRSHAFTLWGRQPQASMLTGDNSQFRPQPRKSQKSTIHQVTITARLKQSNLDKRICFKVCFSVICP
jgi:hypothetical protein